MIKFAHIRPVTNTALSGGYTVAFDHGAVGNKTIRFAIARSHPKMHFHKKVLRDIAKGRLVCERKDLGHSITVDSGKYQDVVQAIIKEVDRLKLHIPTEVYNKSGHRVFGT